MPVVQILERIALTDARPAAQRQIVVFGGRGVWERLCIGGDSRRVQSRESRMVVCQRWRSEGGQRVSDPGPRAVNCHFGF